MHSTNVQELTEAHAAAYLAAKRIDWLHPAEALAADATRNRISAFVGAGKNPMAHYESRATKGGVAGALQLFRRLQSPERAKYIAGGMLRAAREARLNGQTKEAAFALEGAARWRREARDIAREAAAAHQAQPEPFLMAAE
ncbi:hypothetical protein [Leisingera sp. JC11]|uniref:hypothetical protein n=1 Tax=Leisingera sp. JC11 TaxID=3042469 RepID=UPI00345200A0